MINATGVIFLKNGNKTIVIKNKDGCTNGTSPPEAIQGFQEFNAPNAPHALDKSNELLVYITLNKLHARTGLNELNIYNQA